ncbi:MAG: class I SAM-dependent methyltransferase [Candidatus Hydrogenedentes bacterium]|nr:class I SAM-dependent methyltransferase [Candidatus Hydrogenedentota bacterium]
MDAKQRFSDRVEHYIKYRPSYPPQIIDLLGAELGLQPTWAVADVGSGTGILTDLLLRTNVRVYAVEPNREMREAAERLLAARPNFHSVNGAAEATTLEPSSVDLVTAGQAFHWFDGDKTRAEFTRILKPDGNVLLVWNDRKTASTPFLEAYDHLLRTRGLDYEQVNHRNVDHTRLLRFFGAEGYREAVFPNAQHFDWEGLRGRALSSSYVPPEGHPKHATFMDGLAELHRTYQKDSFVRFDYDTRVYYGRLS